MTGYCCAISRLTTSSQTLTAPVCCGHSEFCNTAWLLCLALEHLSDQIRLIFLSPGGLVWCSDVSLFLGLCGGAFLLSSCYLGVSWQLIQSSPAIHLPANLGSRSLTVAPLHNGQLWSRGWCGVRHLLLSSSSHHPLLLSSCKIPASDGFVYA